MKLEQALKQLKNRPELGIPNAEFVLRTREMLLAKMQVEQPEKLSRALGGLSFVQSLVRAFVPPQFAYVTAVFALIVSAVGAGYMSRQALPGTSLYSTKIALEYTQARLVSNPSERAKVQMDMAGRRLQELRAIEQSAEPNGRVEQTLKQFTKEVKSAKNTLKQAGDPLQVEAAAQELAKKARQYEEELLKAKAGVKPGREVGVAALEEALQELSTSQ